jgi:hypothetical protein
MASEIGSGPAVRQNSRAERLIDRFAAGGLPPTFGRVVGLLLLLIAPQIYFLSRGGVRPFRVPAWGIELPMPTGPLLGALGVVYAAAAVALMLRRGGRLAPGVAAVVLGYFASCDLSACTPSFVTMIWLYCVAMLFERPGPSFARRLVQLSVSVCYVVSAIHKAVQPDWISGETIADMARHGTMIRPMFAPAFAVLAPAGVAAAAIAAGVAVGELLVGVGLWSRRTRRAALAGGLALHAAIFIFIEYVEMFTPTMLVGYLAFPTGESPPRPAGVPPRWQAPAAACFALLIVLMPMRFYADAARPAWSLSFLDRSPWSFSMFLFMQETTRVEAARLGTGGDWQSVTVPVQATGWGSDAELRALGRYLLRADPGASAIRIACELTVNHRRVISKRVTVDRPGSAAGPRTGPP